MTWVERLKKHFGRFILAYFTLFALMRVISKPVLELDEAELIYLSQWWFWGYGPQPPLYSWLQNAFVVFLGPNLWSVAVVKALLYGLIFYFAYRIGNYFFARSRAILSSMLLFSSLELMIHSFRHSHTLLVVAMVLISFFLFLRCLEKTSFINSLLLGASLALGLLSKYNFGIFILSLVIVVIWHPEYRLKLRNPGLWVGLLLGFFLIIPHGLWLLEHWTEVRRSVSADMVPGNQPYYRKLINGLNDLIEDSFTLIIPLILIVLVFIWRTAKFKNILPISFGCKGFLPAQVILIQFLTLLGLVFTGLLSDINVRWLQPVWIMLPFVLVYWLKSVFEGLKPDLLTRWLAVWAVLLLLFHPLRNQGELLLGLTNRTHCDFDGLAENLKDQNEIYRGFLTRGYFMAGNLRMQFPDELVLCNFWEPPEPLKDSMLLVVLNSEVKKGESQNKELLLDENECFQAWFQEE
jgi:4-amino-4-deoxy-L-arabinose transferase-like glycosyltransferase